MDKALRESCCVTLIFDSSSGYPNVREYQLEQAQKCLSLHERNFQVML